MPFNIFPEVFVSQNILKIIQTLEFKWCFLAFLKEAEPLEKILGGNPVYEIGYNVSYTHSD